MRKLRLDMQELEVQTFELTGDGAGAGTVGGAERTLNCNTDEFATCEQYSNGPGTCPADSCDNCYTHECVSTDATWRYVNGACV
ncbi:MAG TPA: hypothetical protein VE871_11560 [Longimicrobium sp.]|nr:hypothetical protein [Longimicrobium sp.]